MRKYLGKIVIAVLAIMILFGNAKPYAAYTKGETIKVGVFDMDGFHSFDENGKVSGFCIDYLNVIADITGLSLIHI